MTSKSVEEQLAETGQGSVGDMDDVRAFASSMDAARRTAERIRLEDQQAELRRRRELFLGDQVRAAQLATPFVVTNADLDGLMKRIYTNPLGGLGDVAISEDDLTVWGDLDTAPDPGRGVLNARPSSLAPLITIPAKRAAPKPAPLPEQPATRRYDFNA